MNEKEILKKIGYTGEYNKDVKKRLKELLKKYHPDHYKGSDETFILINKIKKDLEAGKKISINQKTEEKEETSASDTLWYANKINELTKEKESLLKKKENKQKELFKLQDNYKEEYSEDFHNRNDENNNANNIMILQENRLILYMILTIIISISIILLFTKVYYPLIILVILIIILIIKLNNIHKDINEKLNINKKVINKSKKSFAKVSEINQKINRLYQEIWELDCEIGRLNTKINLYYNHIK